MSVFAACLFIRRAATVLSFSADGSVVAIWWWFDDTMDFFQRLAIRIGARAMYSKTQRNVMIGYVAFAIVIIIARHGGFDRHASTPLDLILGAPIPFMFGVFAIQNGWISSRYSAVDRDEAPVTFWFYVAFALLLGAGMFLWGVRDAIR